jgi:hypothetical protein
MKGEVSEMKYWVQPQFNECDEINGFVVAWKTIASFYAGRQQRKVLQSSGYYISCALRCLY